MQITTGLQPPIASDLPGNKDRTGERRRPPQLTNYLQVSQQCFDDLLCSVRWQIAGYHEDYRPRTQWTRTHNGRGNVVIKPDFVVISQHLSVTPANRITQ